MGTGGSFPGDEYLFIAWCLVNHREKFTFAKELKGAAIDSAKGVGWRRQGMHTEFLWRNIFEDVHLEGRGGGTIR
jgi:hypothetical protein